MTEQDTIALIVPEGSELERTGTDAPSGEFESERPLGISIHSYRSDLRIMKFGGLGSKNVSLNRVRADLERVQGQIDDLLANIRTQDEHGFRLDEVEVSLGVTAEGSIGVATAGVQAGIALTFTRRHAVT